MAENQSRLWEIEEFLAAIGGRPVGEMPDFVDGISIDTRTLGEGDGFFAIRGDNFDGHDFVTRAAGAGAVLAVVAEEKLVALGGLTLPLVVVSDVLAAMGQLAMAARKRTKARIIAITGSVGKTTTKEMLAGLLASCGRVHASVASYNNHWGVPLTLARMAKDTEFGIFEIGMNNPGEIAELVQLVRPHGAVITTIGAAHLGAFSSISDIARAKGEIFDGVEKGGFALINRDIRQFSLLSGMAKEAGIETIAGFGAKRGAKFAIKEVIATATGSHIVARLEGKIVNLELPVAGEHMVSNLMAALGAACLSGADMDNVIGAVKEIGTVKGRGENFVYGKGLLTTILIDESYNANPVSMEASLKVLGMHAPRGKGKRVAVLGDMLELGKSSNKLHKELAAPIRAAKVDRVWLVGSDMRELAKEFEEGAQKEGNNSVKLCGLFDDAGQLRGPLLKALRRGDVIMFKASLGIGFGPLVEATKKHLAGN